jgi:hypothetical protein
MQRFAMGEFFAKWLITARPQFLQSAGGFGLFGEVCV